MVRVLKMSSPRRMMCWLDEVLLPTHTPLAHEVVSLCAVDSCFLKWTISAKLQMGEASSLSRLRLYEVFLSEAC